MDKINNISAILGIVGFIFGLFGTLYGLFSWFYVNKIKFYLFCNKFFSSRREIKFDLSTSFKKIDPLNFTEIEEVLKKNGTDYSKENNLSNNKMYNLNGFILSLKQITPIDDDLNVTVRVINSSVTYKTALEIIADYVKIVEMIFDKEGINSKHSRSSLILKYGTKNPFMGRNLANLKSESIKSFICQVNFNEIIGNDDPTTIDNDIIIHKENISYTTNNLSKLLNVAKICFNTYK